MHTCIHACKHAYIHTFRYACMRTYMCTREYTHTDAIPSYIEDPHPPPPLPQAFSPHYGIDFLLRNGKEGWIMLGGVFLTVTGTEAMYADLGHFSDKDKQVTAATVFKVSLKKPPKKNPQ